MKVRPCVPKDLQSIVDLAQKYTSFDTKPAFADIQSMYARNPEYFFVAESDHGGVVGFITGYERKGIPEEVLRTWNAKRVGYIDLMAVNPSHRRMGVGRVLMNVILEEFRKNHVDIVNLDVPAEQEAALRLYESFGFSIRAYNMRKRLT
jgi:ribosomal protein S18 acetylase RimI-like enzyme